MSEEIEEEKITIGIDKATWEEFKKYCAINAYKISKKIELLLREEIERGPKTRDLIDIFKDIVEKQKEEPAQKEEIESITKEPIQKEPAEKIELIKEEPKEEIKKEPEEPAKVVPYNDTLETYDIQQPVPEDVKQAVNNIKPTASETDNPKMLGSKKAPSIAELMMRRKG